MDCRTSPCYSQCQTLPEDNFEQSLCSAVFWFPGDIFYWKKKKKDLNLPSSSSQTLIVWLSLTQFVQSRYSQIYGENSARVKNNIAVQNTLLAEIIYDIFLIFFYFNIDPVIAIAKLTKYLRNDIELRILKLR